ncbi:MAG: hypothetical protein Q4G13_01090, partial [Moraxella sp.]|nr:hypothetical protein [Moraxella sp.]
KKTDTKAVDNEPPQHDSTSHHSSPAALSIPLDERMGSYQPATPSPSVPSPSKPNTQQFPPTDTLALTSSIQLPMGSRAVVRTQRFELMGLSFRHFVLLADVAFMDTATKSVWQSLVQALGKQSAVLALAVKYPMFDNSYVQFKDFHHEQMALGGFLVRLCETAMTHGDLQCLILTPLSQGIELELPMTNAPNLMQMAMHKQAKMALWQILMGE